MIRNGYITTPVSLTVDEHLPPFHTTVPQNKKMWMFDENDYFKKYNLTFCTEKTLKCIYNQQTMKKKITRIPWYNILANKSYANQFGYISPSAISPELRNKMLGDNDDN